MKHLHLVLVFMALLIAGITPAFAQTRTVTGKVTDANGQPVVGATVTASGTKVATQTNSEGIFLISVPASVQRLVITSVGFGSKEVAVNGKTNVSVALAASTSQL